MVDPEPGRELGQTTTVGRYLSRFKLACVVPAGSKLFRCIDRDLARLENTVTVLK